MDHGVRDLQVVVVARATGQSKDYRLILEDKWIQQLETRVPNGCNIKANT